MTRNGADEFLVLILGCPASLAKSRIADAIPTVVASPMDIDGEVVYATVSVGVARYPTDASELDALVSAAQVAVRRAKEHGRNQTRHFLPAANSHAGQRRRMGELVREAIAASTLEVVYQPKLTVESGRFLSVEALVRLRDTENRSMSPGVFLPVAAELGLMRELDALVFRKAIDQLVVWRAAGLGDVSVAVNVSHASFWGPNLVSSLLDGVEKAGLPAGLLELEMTETIVMSDPEPAREILTRLREAGFRIALDDFGTGQTSLGNLRRLPFDTLKIDRSFVTGLPDDDADVTIAKAIVAIGRGLGVSIVAEGVETRAQADLLGALGCDQLQGYHFARPMAADRVFAVLRRRAESVMLEETP